MARRRRGPGRARAGMAMVELVVVLPVLLLVLFAVLELGVLLGRWLTLSNAAREGVREAVLFRLVCDPAAVETAVKGRVKAYAGHLGVALADTDIEVEGECLPRDTTARVTVNLLHTFHVLPGFAPSLEPTLPLAASSEMRNEGNG